MLTEFRKNILVKGLFLLLRDINFFLGKIITPLHELENHILVVSNGKIKEIRPYKKKDSYDYDFSEYVAYPTLINSHDHLLGSYYPKVGPRRPYINWKPWDNDLKDSPLYLERSKISNLNLYYLGAYKNLISGSITVSDHIPHVINDPFISKMPIRIIKDYSIAHEISSFELKWGDNFDIEHKIAIQKNQPFITHIEEGFDEESKKGIEYLLEKECLSEYTVLIHGVGFSNEDIKNIQKHKSHFVWCPVSNMYMFNHTAKIKEILESGINTCIGTDSPMSGSLNILQEVKYAKYLYQKMYSEELDNKKIFEMITINPAKAFRLDSEIGSLEKGKNAEFILIKNREKNPYSLLFQTDIENIDCIFLNGKPIYGSIFFKETFESFDIKYTTFKLFDSDRIIKGKNPIKILEQVRKSVGFKKYIPFLPISLG